MTADAASRVECIHCGKAGTHRVCQECFDATGSASGQPTPAPAMTVDDVSREPGPTLS